MIENSDNSRVVLGKAAGILAIITFGALAVHSYVNGEANLVEASDAAIALLTSEDDFKGKLVELTYPIDSGNQANVNAAEQLVVVPNS